MYARENVDNVESPLTLYHPSAKKGQAKDEIEQLPAYFLDKLYRKVSRTHDQPAPVLVA